MIAKSYRLIHFLINLINHVSNNSGGRALQGVLLLGAKKTFRRRLKLGVPARSLV
jgi:hypothetical protein